MNKVVLIKSVWRFVKNFAVNRHRKQYAELLVNKQFFGGDIHGNDDYQSCWFYNVIPVNLGDYLEQFVMHDELHIDQAQRALAAYRQSRMESGD